MRKSKNCCPSKFWTTILLKANRNVLIEASPRKSPNSGFSALTAGCWYKARVIFVACEHILAQVSGSFFAFYCIVRILSPSSNYLSTNCFYANFKFSQAKARNNFVAPWSLPDLASGQTWVSRVRFPPSERGQPWRSCTPMARRSGCKPVLKVIKNNPKVLGQLPFFG